MMKRVRERGRLKLQMSPSEEMTEEDLNKLLVDAAIPEIILQEMSMEEKKMNCEILLKTKVKPKPETVTGTNDDSSLKMPYVRLVSYDEKRENEKGQGKLESHLTLRSRGGRKGCEEKPDDQPTRTLHNQSSSSNEEGEEKDEVEEKSDGRSKETESSVVRLKKETNKTVAPMETESPILEDAVTQDYNFNTNFMLAPNTERFPDTQSSSLEGNEEAIPESQMSPNEETTVDISSDSHSFCNHMVWLPKYTPSWIDDRPGYAQVIKLMFSIYLRRLRLAQRKIKGKRQKWGEPVRCGSCYKGLLRRQICETVEEENKSDIEERPKRYPTRSSFKNILSTLSIKEPYKWQDESDENQGDNGKDEAERDQELPEKRKSIDQKKKIGLYLSPDYDSGNDILSERETIVDSDSDSKDSDFDPNPVIKTFRSKKTKTVPTRRKNPQKEAAKGKNSKAKSQIQKVSVTTDSISVTGEMESRNDPWFVRSSSEESQNSEKIDGGDQCGNSQVCDRNRPGGDKEDMSSGESGWLSTTVNSGCIGGQGREKNALDLLTYKEDQKSNLDASKRKRIKRKITDSKSCSDVNSSAKMKSRSNMKSSSTVIPFIISCESADNISHTSYQRNPATVLSEIIARKENLSESVTTGDFDGMTGGPFNIKSSDEETQNPERCSVSNVITIGVRDNQSLQRVYNISSDIVSSKDGGAYEFPSTTSQNTMEKADLSSKNSLDKKGNRVQMKDNSFPNLFEDLPEERNPKRKRPQRGLAEKDPSRKMPPRKRRQQTDDEIDLAKNCEEDNVTTNLCEETKKKAKIVMGESNKRSTRKSSKFSQHQVISDEDHHSTDVMEIEENNDDNNVDVDDGHIDHFDDVQISVVEKGTCPICGKEYPATSLEVHASTCSDYFVEQDKVARCMICSEEFGLDDLKAHQAFCLESHVVTDTRSRRKPKAELNTRSGFARSMRTRNRPVEEESPTSSHDDYGELIVETEVKKD